MSKSAKITAKQSTPTDLDVSELPAIRIWLSSSVGAAKIGRKHDFLSRRGIPYQDTQVKGKVGYKLSEGDRRYLKSDIEDLLECPSPESVFLKTFGPLEMSIFRGGWANLATELPGKVYNRPRPVNFKAPICSGSGIEAVKKSPLNINA